MPGNDKGGAPPAMEAEVAKLLVELKEHFAGHSELKDLRSQLDLVKATYEEVKGLSAKKILEEVDRLRAGQENIVKAIRNSRKGPYVSGLEDVRGFDLFRAVKAHITGRWDAAGLEKEVVDNVRKKVGQSAGDDSSGGSFIPDQVIAEVIGAVYVRSIMIALEGAEGETRVDVWPVTGGQVKVPRFEGGLVAYFEGEEETSLESAVKTGDFTFKPRKLKVLGRLSETMMEMDPGVFRAKFNENFIRAAAKKLDWAINYGPGGDDAPRGVFNTPGVRLFCASNGGIGKIGDDVTTGVFPATWSGGEVDFDGLEEMLGALEDDDYELGDEHSIISSGKYFRRLRQLKIASYSGQTTQMAYLLGSPMLSKQRLRDQIGDWASTSQISSIRKAGAQVRATPTTSDAKFTDILAGRLREIKVARWNGVTITDDEGKGIGFKNDQRYFKLRMRVDVQVAQPRGLILCPDARARA